MAIPIPIDGLDFWIPEVPDGGVVALLGDGGGAASFLANRMAQRAASMGRPVRFVSTRQPPPVLADVQSRAPTGVAAKPAVVQHELGATTVDMPGLLQDHDLVVDSYGVMTAGLPLADAVGDLRRMQASARVSGYACILVTDAMMLDAPRRAALTHFADGIVEFRSREDADSSQHYLRIPRWCDGRAVAQNIFFNFDGRHLLVDTRKRVV